MNIRIKELFKSDLDPNSNEWWSKDKIDKINFNFRLMKNGGPSGPVGIEGPNGEDGDKGEDGLQGAEGPRGPQGPTGPESSGTWKSQDIIYDSNITQRVIYPSIADNQSGTVTLAIGASAHLDINGELISPYYGELSTEPISASKSGTLNIITEASIGSGSNVAPSPKDSITLAEDKDLDKSYTIGLKIEEDSNNIEFPVLTFSPADNANNKFAIKFDRDNRFYLNATPLMSSTSNVLGAESVIPYNLNVDASAAGREIEFRVGEIKYSNHTPSLNKILRSYDTEGTVQWDDVFNMFQVFPVGSIIRIPKDAFFTEANFNLADAVTGPMLIVDGDELVKTNFGSGKSTGIYAGWYLCNGETWGDGGIKAYDTPNLNGFDWAIVDIPGLDGGTTSSSVSGGSLATYNGDILFSGGISTLSLDPSGINTNVISHSYDNSIEDAVAYDIEGNSNNLSENIIMGEQISIIYLKEYDYNWSTLAAPVSSSGIQLQYHAMTGDTDTNTVASGSYTNIDIAMQYATTLNPEIIQWTADGAPSDGAQLDAYWNTDSNFANGNIRCYVNGQELADGWLARESGGMNGWGYAREYINGVGISPDAALETEPKECWMLYSESVNGVDGDYNSFGINYNGVLPPVTMPEADVTSFNGWPAGTSLEKVFISNVIDNHPDVVGSSSDFKDYENTSHIWKRNNGSNTINQLTNGWYRSVPETLTYNVNFGFGGSLPIPAGLYLSWRKYWSANDNEFKGDVIKTRFVQWSVGDLSLGIGTSAACNATSGNDIFYSSDMFELGENSGSWQVTNLGGGTGSQSNGRLYSWLSNQIYVRLDNSSNTNGGSNANLGKYPLTLVKSDTFIPGTSNSLKIADWTGDSATSGYTGEHYKSIDSNSQATAAPTACSTPPPLGAVFEWDEDNSGNNLGTYNGTGGTGNVHFTFTGNNSGLTSAQNFSIDQPDGLPFNSVNISYDAPDNYITLDAAFTLDKPFENLTLSFDYPQGQLNSNASELDIDIAVNPCHVEGTIINMENGTTKLVENLKVGDILDSFDIKGLSDDDEWGSFKTNAMEFKAPKSSAKLVKIIKGTYKNYQDINSGLTKITNEHPVLIKRPDGEIFFKQALYIDTTDMIYVNEKWTKVESNETIHETVNTYSINVEDEDVYVADGILCHNAGEPLYKID